MPRQARLVVPGLPIHVVQRGLNKQPCFRREADYLVYLALMRQSAAKFGCAIHAHCLMTNHVHILMTPQNAGACAGMMHGVAQRYAHYFNSSDERSGTLWEGRFRSCIVESDEYVLACYRYIELNPVRAGMVSHPEKYPWSSYAANSGSRIDPLISAHPAFAQLSRREYAQMVQMGLEGKLLAGIREATNSGYPLASETFKADLSKRAGRRLIPARAGRPRKADEKKSVDVPDLFSGGAVS